MRPYKQLLAIIFLIIILSSNYAIFAQETPENITIEFDTETYGQVSQSLGVIVPNSLSPQTVGEIKSTFPNGTIYLKLVNPTTSTVNSSGFQELYQAGFKWYFLFTNANNAFGVVDAYTGLYSPERLVIEVEKDDTAFITDLKGSYSAVRIHAGHLPVWPRSQVNEILSQVQPPTIEGISFWLGLIDEGQGVFRDVEFAFDTLFDASKAIAGEKVNFPANTILSMSNNQFPSYSDQRKTAYLSGLLSGTVITSVQSQGRGGEAPIRYVIPGTFDQFSASEKVLLFHFARFMSLSPQIVWPYAIPNNGDIWDNGIFPQSNTKPIVGVIGKIDQGYYGFITNAGEAPVKAVFSSGNDLSLYTKISTMKPQVTVTDGSIFLDAHETVIFHPASLPNISPVPTDDITITQPPTAPPDATCEQKKRTGDYNCNNITNDEDFNQWLSDFTQKKVTVLQYFESWRRSFY